MVQYSFAVTGWALITREITLYSLRSYALENVIHPMTTVIPEKTIFTTIPIPTILILFNLLSYLIGSYRAWNNIHTPFLWRVWVVVRMDSFIIVAISFTILKI